MEETTPVPIVCSVPLSPDADAREQIQLRNPLFGTYSCTSQLSLRGVEPRALKQMTTLGAYCTRSSLCLNALTAKSVGELHSSVVASGLSSTVQCRTSKPCG